MHAPPLRRRTRRRTGSIFMYHTDVLHRGSTMTGTARRRFGFPPPGHEYWNEQTLRDVGTRWPGIDLDPYRAAGR